MQQPDKAELQACIAWLERGEDPVISWASGYPEYRPEVMNLVRVASRPFWNDKDYPKHVPRTIDEATIADADLPLMRALMTSFQRLERFSDGHWASMISSGKALMMFRRALALLE